MKADKASVNWVELRRSIEPLLSLTLDQLSTFSAICERESIRQTALAIGRDQSSVEKQLQTMERNFERVTNEKLVLRSEKRGTKIHLTRSGTSVRELAQDVLLLAMDTATHLRKLQQNYTIRIGLGTWMLPFLIAIQEQIAKTFEHSGVKLIPDLQHFQPSDIQTILQRDKCLDFCMAIVMAKAGEPAVMQDGLEFAEWRRDELVLLSNWKVPGGTLAVSDLTKKRIPLIMPKSGIVPEFVSHLVDDLQALNVVQYCNDGNFALDLLRLGPQDCGIVCGEYVVKHAKSLPPGKNLYETRFKGSKIQLCIGLMQREGASRGYPESHPVRMFWDTFVELASRTHNTRLSKSI
jgi:DNA-binding transcriptional LysR family regulator